jgi:hypothetical protein
MTVICLALWWSLFSRRDPSPPQPSYGGTLRLNFSLCLVKEGFFLGKLRKSSKPITAVRQAI